MIYTETRFLSDVQLGAFQICKKKL